MRKILIFFRTIFLSIFFCLTVGIWLLSLFQDTVRLASTVPIITTDTVGTTATYPSVFDAFCGNFTRNVYSELYINYTSTNLTRGVYSRAGFTHAGKFHFAVISAPRNFRARRTIRRTWKKLLQNHESCAKFASLLFYVGKTSDPTAAGWLARELRDHPDDMVLIDFCDAYENLPIKTFNTMRFINERYPKIDYVVKMDDDVMPNIHLFSRCFPVKVADRQFGLYGWVTIDKVPDPGGKYQIVPGRYRNTTFPPFTHGPAYVVRRSDLSALLQAALRTPVLNLEDVWFTGVVADAAGVQRKNASHFLEMYRKPKEFDGDVKKAMKRAFFFHRVTPTTISRVWAKYPQNCDAEEGATFCSDF